MRSDTRFFLFMVLVIPMLGPTVYSQTASGPAVFSGLFGSREIDLETPNNPGSNYEMVLHINEPDWYEDELLYTAERGWGFEPVYEDDLLYGERNGSGIFGPFDDSPNDRNNFGADDEHYNSFIGFKSHAEPCNALIFDDENPQAPCSDAIDPSGGIFRVDVPNGKYRFVAVFGDSQHNHAHRALVEDGGSGDPTEIGPNHVTLVGNHNTPDYVQYVLSEDFPGSDLSVGRDMDEGGNLAMVGFEGSLPPLPQSDPDESPLFVMYDDNGNALLDENGAPVGLDAASPSSPVLEVTQGYLRLHLLQGNSNEFEDEDGNLYPADANGADVIIFEVIPVDDGLAGDYNGDGALGVDDINALSAAAAGGANPAEFDLTGDGNVNADDINNWIKDLANSWVGDANVDGEFNSGDFVQVFGAGKFESGQDASWAEGDWNGDGKFDSGDFVAAFSDGGFELGPRPAAAVPEPSSLGLILLGVLGLAGVIRKR